MPYQPSASSRFNTKAPTPKKKLMSPKNIVTIAIASIIALFALIVVGSSFYTVESGTVGVVKTFGKYSPDVATAGFHVKTPFINSVEIEDVKQQTVNYSGTAEKGDRGNDGILTVADLDVLDALNVHYDIELTLMYTPIAEKMPQILSDYGVNYFEKKINPIVRDVVRDVGGKYNVETIADHREEINTKIRARLVEEFKPLPFIFNDVKLRQIKLPSSIMEKILAVQNAKQEAQKLEIDNQKAVLQKQIAITVAEGKAAEVTINAKAEADAILMTADAQSKANDKLNNSLTPLLVESQKIAKWDGALPTVSSGSGGSLLVDVRGATK